MIGVVKEEKFGIWRLIWQLAYVFFCLENYHRYYVRIGLVRPELGGAGGIQKLLVILIYPFIKGERLYYWSRFFVLTS